MSIKHIGAVAVGISVRRGGYGALIRSLNVVPGLYLMGSSNATHLVFEKHATSASQVNG